MNKYTEDNLVEQPAIKLFESLWYDISNNFDEKFDWTSEFGRTEMNEPYLMNYLKIALVSLNPDVSTEWLNLAIDEIIKDRSMMSLVDANKEVYQLLRNWVKVEVENEKWERIIETVTVIDFKNLENNHFMLCSQFWIAWETYKRRADLVWFVNWLPLIFIELKASHKNVKNAFKDNLRDYKDTVPQLFWYNAFIILSNWIDSKIWSITSNWEHFYEWKRINSEWEKGIVSLETMIKWTCTKEIFIDILENFVLFDDSEWSLIKIVPRNCQYLGVNNAMTSFQQREKTNWKIWVFWHTQGAWKSLSMVFFTQKVLRKAHWNYSFLVVTDRTDLDNQIYKQFQNAWATTEWEIQATSRENLKQLLTENHRLLFTLIQKFWTNKWETFPVLSDRSDIIVMTDEAHRSQYQTFALNMRSALPNACFIWFTWTPLIKWEDEKTKEVFWDYVSVYNFKQSIDDWVTVPLYYENRIPELQLTNKDFNEDLEELIEKAELDEEQEKKLERQFARQYHLITRDDRLEKISEDMVKHFFWRWFKWKAMVVSIDKVTTVKMYDKFQKHLKNYQKELEDKLKTSSASEEKELLQKLKEIKEFDSAVVVSQSQNEIADFREKWLDMKTHRERFINEDLEKSFKDSDSNLRMVFVCNMWLTWFNVPSMSTIYLDKPIKNHSLMQAISRANRVYEWKNNWLIVDYVWVFKDLQKALAVYASDISDWWEDWSIWPINSKDELIKELELVLNEIDKFCNKLSITLEDMIKAEGFQISLFLKDYVNKIVVNEETKKQFQSLASRTSKLFKAILPDIKASEFLPKVSAIKVIAARILSLQSQADIEEIEWDIEKLLDESIETWGYTISTLAKVDLSKIDFDKLKDEFQKNQQNITNEALKNKVSDKLMQMIKLNPVRASLMQKFQNLLDEYNAWTMNAEVFFEKLIEFTKELNEEEKRGLSEELTEEELAIFDILQKPDLSESDIKEVKKTAKNLLQTLKTKKLVMDWKKTQQRRAWVLVTIKDRLDEWLPDSYDDKIFVIKCDEVYKHVYDSYDSWNKSVYEWAFA